MRQLDKGIEEDEEEEREEEEEAAEEEEEEQQQQQQQHQQHQQQNRQQQQQIYWYSAKKRNKMANVTVDENHPTIENIFCIPGPYEVYQQVLFVSLNITLGIVVFLGNA